MISIPHNHTFDIGVMWESFYGHEFATMCISHMHVKMKEFKQILKV